MAKLERVTSFYHTDSAEEFINRLNLEGIETNTEIVPDDIDGESHMIVVFASDIRKAKTIFKEMFEQEDED
ncbi:hypothetical protein POF51_26485 [Brevibacillus sp. AG]|uniref:hypothetical protein n=1 Tax=Brevibacillus sp. AG TaxID=3020891 RepID=UPI00232AE439|nr:hypothetical protein [Brevibacillus sp. AG]MDC0764272.1 hypothetical protein [Brevibacillus sp. AG]